MVISIQNAARGGIETGYLVYGVIDTSSLSVEKERIYVWIFKVWCRKASGAFNEPSGYGAFLVWDAKATVAIRPSRGAWNARDEKNKSKDLIDLHDGIEGRLLQKAQKVSQGWVQEQSQKEVFQS